MKLNVYEFHVVQQLLQCIPPRVPSRSTEIAVLGKSVVENKELEIYGPFENESDFVYIDGITESFSFTKECMDVVIRNEAKFISFQIKSNLPIMVVPTITYCCRRSIKIDHRHTISVLYDLDNAQQMYCFHGRCQICKMSYYPNFQCNVNGGREYFDFGDTIDFLMVTSQTAFKLKMLKHIDAMVTVGQVSFERIANVFNRSLELVNTSRELNKCRLQSVWFVYRLLQYKKVFEVWPRKTHGEFHLEELCSLYYNEIKEMIDSKWLQHKCENEGCASRAVVIDGNEKLYRYICSSKKERVSGNPGEPNLFKGCINYPIISNKYTQGSPLCAVHENNQSGQTAEQIDIYPKTRSYCRDIQLRVLSEEGCKKSSQLNKYYDRTAGMFYFFRSCGIRLSHREIYYSEACSDVFVDLIDIFGVTPNVSDVSAIFYDRACDLKPFIDRLAANGNCAAGNYEKLDYVLDKFHASGHIEKYCVLNNSECKYHPDLPKFEKYRQVNTQVAEQSFNVLNMYKYTTRRMALSTRMMFFKFIDDSANILKEKDNNSMDIN